MANRKKIFDITPPKEFQKPQEPQIPQAPLKNLKAKEILVKKLIPKKLPDFRAGKPFFISIIMVVGLLLIGALCLIFINPQAELKIWPVKEAIELEAQFSSVGEVIKKEHSFSQEFPATGKATREEKAQGVIRVYNNYHLAQILVVNTRFWCFENEELREFKTKERVVIASQKHLDIEVVASSAGEEYNIGLCTFSVPGLKGSSRYTAVYGESFSPMTGGKKIETIQVSQEDLDKAEIISKEKVLEECQASLENSISSEEYIIIEEAMRLEITKVTPLTEEGQTVDNFIFQVEAEGEVLVLKKSDLKDFAKEYVLGQIPSGKELVEGSLAIGYLPETVDFEESKITLDIEISAEIYSAIDEISLKERVKSKRPDEIKTVLRNFPEIDEVQTRLWPFWITTAPEDTASIKIKLILD